MKTSEFAVLDEKRKVIEGTFPSKKSAKQFASDYRAVHHGPLPVVVATLRILKPGYRICPDDLA